MEQGGNMKLDFSDISRKVELTARLRSKISSIDAEFLQIKSRVRSQPINKLIGLFPVLSEELEAFILDKKGWGMALLRRKENPKVAVLIYSRTIYQTGTNGGIIFNLPLPGLGTLSLKFQAPCSCCSSELNGCETPYDFNEPECPECIRGENESDSVYLRRYDKNREEHEKKVAVLKKNWVSSGEKKGYDQTRSKIREDYIKNIAKVCIENGINHILVRYASPLGHKLKDFGVKVYEITEKENWVKFNFPGEPLCNDPSRTTYYLIPHEEDR